jgi:hypothetical protein
VSESVYPAICGSYQLHSEHSWREGFLLLRKVTCLGSIPPKGVPILPSDFIPPSAALKPFEKPHKHTYQLRSEFTFGQKNEGDILWRCTVCKNYFATPRKLFWDKGIWYDIY